MRYYEDFEVGEVTEVGPVSVTEDEIVEFATRYIPQPFHTDLTPPPDPALREKVLGAPKMALDLSDVKVGYSPGSGFERRLTS